MHTLGLAAFSRLAIFQDAMVSHSISMATGPDGDDGLDEIETGVATRTRP